MINLNKAMDILNKTYPERTIVQAIDYSDKWYLFAAVEDTNSVDYDAPYYVVNKNTGSVRTYSPMADLKNFTDAIKNRVIDIS